MLMHDLTYQVTMSFVRQLYEDGLITDEEYKEFDTRMVEKYKPEIGQLLTDIDLTIF